MKRNKRSSKIKKSANLKVFHKSFSEKKQESKKNKDSSRKKIPETKKTKNKVVTIPAENNKTAEVKQTAEIKEKNPQQFLEGIQGKKHEASKSENLKIQTINYGRITEKKEKGEVIDSYEVEADGAKIKIEITKEQLGLAYNLSIPEIHQATLALLNDIRRELIAITSVSMQELSDPKLFNSIKKRFKEQTTKLIKEKLPNLNKDIERFLVGSLIQEMLGLGKTEYLISDPNLEEIVMISSKEPVRVFSKKYGWLDTNLTVEEEEEILNYSNIIARRVGRQITVLNPLLDAHLLTGDRVNSVLYPINTKGNTITIRKFSRDPYTIVDLIKNSTCDLEIAALLWLAIEYEMNVIISGGTASGKTVLLNACMPFIPPNQRIISIEDTKELMLPEFLYWTPLVTRLPNPEGKGAVTMFDLLVNSLRMRPDRIILGEMRKHEEAMVLFEAMHTGHSVYATLHADSAPETVSRLINPPLSVPANLLKAINLNVVMFRDRRKGIRRVLQIAEIEAEGDMAKANTIYRWSSESDKMIKHSKSIRFFEDISRHTSMSEAEVTSALEEKKKILSWMIKNNIRRLDEMGRVMNLYYKNKKYLLELINKNNINAITQNEK